MPDTDTVPPPSHPSDLNVQRTQELAAAAADPALPLSGVFGPGSADLDSLTAVCRRVGWHPAPVHDPFLGRAIQALCRALPLLHALPAPQVPPELGWAEVRCFFAGFGYPYWPEICEAMHRLRPDCPWEATETQAEWYAEAESARRICGWPLALPAVPWHALVSLVRREEDAVPVLWMRLCTAWHLLRHLWWSDAHGLVTTWNGTITATTPPTGTTAMATVPSLSALTPSLDVPVVGPVKQQHPLAVAARAFLTRAPRTLLLRRRPLTALSGAVIAGPWSTPIPRLDPTCRWWGHQLTVADVYVASNGTVTLAQDLDPESVLSFDWTPHPLTHPQTQARDLWRQSIVPTYTASDWPTEILCQSFPNLRHLGPGHLALIDAVLIASLLRPEEPRLEYEFPLVLLLAGDPSAEASTNNGKTACTQALVQAMHPGAPVMVVPRHPGAPDRRIMWQLLTEHGTLGLDEWSVPLDDTHVLNRENLQALCVGRSVGFGLVLDNRPHLARLASSLVANAKAIRLPPDILNRSVILWLDPLTNVQRANAQAYEEVLNGKASLRLRLAALSVLENTNLVLPAAAATTSAGSRYGIHRAIAAHVYRVRCGGTETEAMTAVDRAHAAMLKEYHAHTAAAGSSGLLAELSSGKALEAIQMDEVFDNIPLLTLPAIRADLAARQRYIKGNMATDFLQALTASERARDPSATLAETLGRLMGLETIGKLRPRAIARRLLSEMQRLMPEVDSRWPLPGDAGLAGWHIQATGTDAEGHYFFRLLCDNPHPVSPMEPETP